MTHTDVSRPRSRRRTVLITLAVITGALVAGTLHLTGVLPPG